MHTENMSHAYEFVFDVHACSDRQKCRNNPSDLQWPSENITGHHWCSLTAHGWHGQ